jgi:hypothetical protein
MVYGVWCMVYIVCFMRKTKGYRKKIYKPQGRGFVWHIKFGMAYFAL